MISSPGRQSHKSEGGIFQLKLKSYMHHLLRKGFYNRAFGSIYLKDILDRLSMPDYYYSCSKKVWRFILLEATDINYFSNSLHDLKIQELDLYL